MATISNSKLFTALRTWTKTLGFKIALIIYAITFVAIALINTYPLAKTRSLIVTSMRSDTLQTANIIASSLSNLSVLEESKIESIMNILDLQESERILVTNMYGTIVYDSAPRGNRTGNVLLLPELVSALSGYDSFHCQYSRGTFESRACVPLYNTETLAGAIFIYECDTYQASLLLSMENNIRMMTFILLLFSILTTSVFTSIIQRRINNLSAAVTEMREGNYSHRIESKGQDEISHIANEFDELAVRLETTESVRRQFVSNASHELKTPLASIKLLSDSILQTDDISIEDIHDFLRDISDEISRLTRITDRLLTLTRLDVKQHTQFQPVNIGDVVTRAVRMLTPLAESQNVDLNCGVADNCIVMAEEDGMYQVIFNLVENAIKYNHEGGNVRVIAYVRDELVYCIIDDTGIGVPEQELEHIFERFYRVDKARARATGGTGLGLSIVRNTIEEYSGRVWAERRVPEGTRFTFTIPAISGGDYDN